MAETPAKTNDAFKQAFRRFEGRLPRKDDPKVQRAIGELKADIRRLLTEEKSQ